MLLGTPRSRKLCGVLEPAPGLSFASSAIMGESPNPLLDGFKGGHLHKAQSSCFNVFSVFSSHLPPHRPVLKSDKCGSGIQGDKTHTSVPIVSLKTMWLESGPEDELQPWPLLTADSPAMSHPGRQGVTGIGCHLALALSSPRAAQGGGWSVA